ncbi:MAG: PepSY domain-containing protein [Solirubrobacteraceae bacterium]
MAAALSALVTGTALDRASAVAVAHTGGRVTDSEVGDEAGYYEVEVTRPDGTSVDVRLDRRFNVIGNHANTEDARGSDPNGR